MDRRPPTASVPPAVDDDLVFEIMKSEHLRIQALMVLLGSLFVLSLIIVSVPRERVPFVRLAEGELPVVAIAVFYGVAFCYELLAHTMLGFLIRRRRRLPEPPRYGNAFIETSFPTVMIALLTGAIGPEAALNSPLPMLYFVFIALSTLRLTAPLAIFTGCVAGLEFTALGLHYLGPDVGLERLSSSLWPILMKSLIMVLTGGVCAFVASQIRRRLVASLASQAERARVVGMFGQYVSPAVVERLLASPVDAKGEIKHVTVMFLDIRGFTSFAERRTPEEVVDYLNTLFAMMITQINEHHGIINKFLGDGFMACFGAPLSDGRDTQNAVRAAIAIAEAVQRMNAEGTIAPTRIGIGLHAGAAVTGSVGSAERREYTIIGDTVNLASRVEQLTKHYGSVLLVTDAVWQVVKDDYPGRPLDPVSVRGREEPVAIHALL